MSQWSAVKRTYQMAKKLHRQRGGWTAAYFFDAISCGYRHQASPENYFVLRFYELNDTERKTYLTSGRSSKADRELNQFLTKEEGKIMSHKHLFYQTFEGLVKRKALYAPETTYSEFSEFLDNHDTFILKPDRGIMGHGIEKVHTKDIADRKAFFEKCKNEKLLVEELIKQHEILEEICPGCVNSMRINVARDKQGKVHLIGACLKCGGAGAVADNFHSGGIAYPVDMETGTIVGPGRNNTEIKDYEKHPASQVTMPGLVIPHWEAVRTCALEAMERIPNIGYVGWDIAVTGSGPELIEGNCRWPGGNIIQLDKIGKYPLIKKCLEGEKGE